MGIFFLIIMFCPAIHVYTVRFTDMGIIVMTFVPPPPPPPLAEVRISLRAAARAYFLLINKGAGQFYLSFDTR